MQTAFTGINNKDAFFPVTRDRGYEANKTAAINRSDELSIGIMTPEKTQALLNRQIADKLEQRFKEEGIELGGLQAEDFTPDKVSERILGFVSGRILTEQDNEKQTALMEQARKGIEQGFSEAREILESLDVLNGKIKDDVESTYDLIQRGLERLERQINGLPDDDSDDAEQDIVRVHQSAIQNSFSRNENTQVEIITRDGDTVQIDLSKQQSGQSMRTFSHNEDGASSSFSRSLSASSSISYQVQGELDEDEQEAIDHLLNDVAKVSDSFFSGNVQYAFKSAMKLDFDNEELSRLSVNFDYQESRQVAISTYSDYQSQSRDDNRGDDKLSPTQSSLKEMSDFVRQIDHLFQNPFAMNKFAQPEQGIEDLLKGVNQLLHSDEMKTLENDSSALLDSLVNQLKQLNEPEKEKSGSDATQDMAG